jgi:feruloyl esterase
MKRLGAHFALLAFAAAMPDCYSQEPVAGEPQTSCATLASATLPNTTITLAKGVAAGKFVSDVQAPFFAPPADYAALPAFCRVAATVSPVQGSQIEFELWLPEHGWNGRFVGVGDGANMGTIHHWDMAPYLASGYAVANSNTGHNGGPIDGSFMRRHEPLVDFAGRSEHEMTIKAKALIVAYYGRSAAHAYFTGCSTGGRQALAEAQRYPDDYDGIAAFAAVANWVPLNIWALHVERILTDESVPMLTRKLPLIRDAAIAACDGLDGVTDRVVDDPRACHFDPAVLACKATAGPDCLDEAELAAVRRLYAGPANPRTGERLYTPGPPTGETVWAFYTPDVLPFADEYFPNAVFDDPAWRISDFDFDTDVARTRQADGGLMSPRDPDLSAFVSHGGKLLLLHGWSDGAVSPFDSISYYQSVLDRLGHAATSSVRLFMLPGVEHCSGGEGPDRIDELAALRAWIDRGRAPERIVASKQLPNGGARTRPLCAYPKVASYDGAGSTDDARSFTCSGADAYSGSAARWPSP